MKDFLNRTGPPAAVAGIAENSLDRPLIKTRDETCCLPITPRKPYQTATKLL